MIASHSAGGPERRRAVADFATKLFGTSVSEANVLEESLVPFSQLASIPTGELRQALQSELPGDAAVLIRSPLTAWIETTVGIEKAPTGSTAGRYRKVSVPSGGAGECSTPRLILEARERLQRMR